jgi:hypothetical protein
MLLNVMDRANVRMVQCRCGPGFALKAFERLGIFGDVIGKKFQRDEATELGVLGFVHDSHAAATKLLNDAAVGDDLAEERWRIGHCGEF